MGILLNLKKCTELPVKNERMEQNTGEEEDGWGCSAGSAASSSYNVLSDIGLRNCQKQLFREEGQAERSRITGTRASIQTWKQIMQTVKEGLLSVLQDENGYSQLTFWWCSQGWKISISIISNT